MFARTSPPFCRASIVYLLDRIAQCRAPFIIVNDRDGERWHLSGAAEAGADIRNCPTRYVLSDDLTTLCTDLAYSKGARVFGCMDLLRIPAERLWIEWSYHPWLLRMSEYGFRNDPAHPAEGRYGILVQAVADGLIGTMRSFWSFGQPQPAVFASAVVSRFRLDGPLDVRSPLGAAVAARPAVLRVNDRDSDPDDCLSRCFDFGFEESWARYYTHQIRDERLRCEVLRVSTGALAPAVPFLLAFLLLLLNRDRLPQQPSQLTHLNAARGLAGKHPLLDHIQVRAPIFAGTTAAAGPTPTTGRRRPPRLHHVRGHLVRRADQLFWRVPHLRGSARRGIVQSRTVTWIVDATAPHL
jgi:hypothetical protein